MTFDETLYGRDDEMDEYGDSGAYGDSLEEDYEHEEEEEEEEVPGGETQPEPAAPAPTTPSAGGGGGDGKPARKSGYNFRSFAIQRPDRNRQRHRPLIPAVPEETRPANQDDQHHDHRDAGPDW